MVCTIGNKWEGVANYIDARSSVLLDRAQTREKREDQMASGQGHVYLLCLLTWPAGSPGSKPLCTSHVVTMTMWKTAERGVHSQEANQDRGDEEEKA